MDRHASRAPLSTPGVERISRTVGLSSARPPGLEPGISAPKAEVLPITPRPNGDATGMLPRDLLHLTQPPLSPDPPQPPPRRPSCPAYEPRSPAGLRPRPPLPGGGRVRLPGTNP